MKLKDVVRGVDEIEIQAMTTIRAEGYNLLASAEVVVDREKLKKLVMSNICSQKCIGYADVDCSEPENSEYFCDEVKEMGEVIAQAIATAIESGAVLSLKKED